MRFPGRNWVFALLVAAGAAAPSHARAVRACPPDPSLPPLTLPHLRAAMAEGHQGIIAALGSSSTEGLGASRLSRSYPAALQAELSAALPGWHVAVINRGIAGQDAPRELERLEADVIALRPQLAIWQVGANAALRDADPEAFRRLVLAGVERLHRAGIDVVLMDNQRAPRILAKAGDAALDRVLADVARQSGASLFSRDRLMAGWESTGVAPAAFIATDGLHHNDDGYRCMARSLARGILAALIPEAASN
jgi:acyl-CoA thioesterase-1